MGKSASFAKKKMRENNNNQFRPEQQQMCREIGREFPEWDVLMEVFIHYTTEDNRLTCAIVDICIEEIGVCYRLNGEIHYTSDKQIEHDWEQKLYLEGLGLMVIDVDTRT